MSCSPIGWTCLLKYYPRRPCVPSFFKSRILRPLQRHFLLFQQIFFILVCIHVGNPRVPPRVLAQRPKPCGGKKHQSPDLKLICKVIATQFFQSRGSHTHKSWNSWQDSNACIVFMGVMLLSMCY